MQINVQFIKYSHLYGIHWVCSYYTKNIDYLHFLPKLLSKMYTSCDKKGIYTVQYTVYFFRKGKEFKKKNQQKGRGVFVIPQCPSNTTCYKIIPCFSGRHYFLKSIFIVFVNFIVLVNFYCICEISKFSKNLVNNYKLESQYYWPNIRSGRLRTICSRTKV